jgi:hypothetical protein
MKQPFQSRPGPVWGLVFVAIGALLLLRALDIIPEGLYDIATRGWPALLVLAGLSAILRTRVPFGGFVALVIAGGLVAGMTLVAYSRQAGQQQDGQQLALESLWAEAADPVDLTTVSLLEVNLETLATDVEIIPEDDLSAGITGNFVGSTESAIEVTYVVGGDGERAVFTLRETPRRDFPLLEEIGRGELTLRVPVGIPVAIAFTGDEGDAVLNLSDLSLERLNISLASGDLVVTLPEYEPQSPNAAEQPGTLETRDGDITVLVPLAVGVRFELNREGSGIEPRFDPNVYNYFVGDVLETREYEEFDLRLRYIITAPSGEIRLDSIQAAGS